MESIKKNQFKFIHFFIFSGVLFISTIGDASAAPNDAVDVNPALGEKASKVISKPFKKAFNWAKCNTNCKLKAKKCRDEDYYKECADNCVQFKGPRETLKKCFAYYKEANLLSCEEKETLINSAKKVARIFNKPELAYSEQDEKMISSDCTQATISTPDDETTPDTQGLLQQELKSRLDKRRMNAAADAGE